MSDIRTGNSEVDVVLWQIPSFDIEIHHRFPGNGSLEDRADVVLKEAYSEGFERGRREGMESARDETSTLVSGFVDVMESLSHYTQDFDEQIARDLVELSTKIAEQVILKELSIAPELLIGIVEKIFDSLPDKGSRVSVYLHPQDATAFNDQLAGSEHEFWKILEDSELNRGDCRLESNDSIISNKLEEQIETMLTTLLERDASDKLTT